MEVREVIWGTNIDMLRYYKSGQGTRVDAWWVIEDRNLCGMDEVEKELSEGAVKMEVA